MTDKIQDARVGLQSQGTAVGSTAKSTSGDAPTPWKVDEDAGLFMLRDATDEYLGEIDIEQHADQIVRAVNAHSALVEALKCVLREDGIDPDGSLNFTSPRHDLIVVAKALALAEPK